MKPNVLLVVFDTARADGFEPYGAVGGASPAVAQLASAGSAHAAAYASSSWTVPSHASLFSGLLPRTAGVHLGGQRTDTFRQILTELRPRLLPTVLSAAGYRSVGISANGWLSANSGFDVGFDEFAYLTSPRYTRLGARNLKARARWALDGLQARLDDGAAEIERRLASAVRGHRPFFCFVNLVECGFMGHAFSLDERLIRVPFVTAGPLSLDAGPLLSLADVPGLLADAVGLADHPWGDGHQGREVAVAQFEAPAEAGAEAAVEVVRQYDLDPVGEARLSRSFAVATDGRVKLFRDARGEEIVDLVDDPLEANPTPVPAAAGERLDDPGSTLARLRRALDDADATTRARLPSTDGADRTAEPSSSADEEAELEAQMRLLGYL